MLRCRAGEKVDPGSGEARHFFSRNGNDGKWQKFLRKQRKMTENSGKWQRMAKKFCNNDGKRQKMAFSQARHIATSGARHFTFSSTLLRCLFTNSTINLFLEFIPLKVFTILRPSSRFNPFTTNNANFCAAVRYFYFSWFDSCIILRQYFTVHLSILNLCIFSKWWEGWQRRIQSSCHF